MRATVRSAVVVRTRARQSDTGRAIFASSAPCAGVVSNLEKLPTRRQSFLSATIAEGKVGLNQSDPLEASNRMHVYELRPRKDKRGVDLNSTGNIQGIGIPSRVMKAPTVGLPVIKSGRTTGTTTGTIGSTNTSVNVQYQIRCGQGKKYVISYTKPGSHQQQQF